MNVKFNAGNIRTERFAGMKMIPLHRQLFQFPLQLLKVDSEVQEGPEKHIAADPAKNIEIENIHQARSFREASWLIWLAAYPAPKPLSMFTTVTPLPQLFSIPRRAASPPKLAP